MTGTSRASNATNGRPPILTQLQVIKGKDQDIAKLEIRKSSQIVWRQIMMESDRFQIATEGRKILTLIENTLS